jgi:hypothetical protein
VRQPSAILPVGPAAIGIIIITPVRLQIPGPRTGGIIYEDRDGGIPWQRSV